MPIHFENITESLLRFPDVINQIPDVLRNPAANPLQAAVLLGIGIVIVLIVLLSIVLMLMNRAEAEQFLIEGESDVAEGGETEESAAEARHPLWWLTVTSIIILAFTGVWIAAGITTSSSDVCVGCHADTVHSIAPPDDPHAKVACVLCHETGGPVARVTVNLATRAQHVVRARVYSNFVRAFGKPVASDGCLRCHRKQINGTVYNVAQGVRVSHKEALAAGAQCVECHALVSGAVGSHTVGMSPCLRCHNGTVARADCNECHVGDPSGAIRAQVATNTMASAQVPNPRCNGCHTDMTKCNACHGIEMPHSDLFKAYAHARPAAIDIWSNGGRTCAKCHYPGHNYCMQPGCHLGPNPSHPSPVWRSMHALAPWSQSATACSCHQWNPWDHNGMNFCQICHPVKPKNAKP
jgi:hypothetical protein